MQMTMMRGGYGLSRSMYGPYSGGYGSMSMYGGPRTDLTAELGLGVNGYYNGYYPYSGGYYGGGYGGGYGGMYGGMYGYGRGMYGGYGGYGGGYGGMYGGMYG